MAQLGGTEWKGYLLGQQPISAEADGSHWYVARNTRSNLLAAIKASPVPSAPPDFRLIGEEWRADHRDRFRTGNGSAPRIICGVAYTLHFPLCAGTEGIVYFRLEATALLLP